MFTGLVEELGTVVAVRGDAALSRLSFRAPHVREGLALGDSVAVNGACLTVVELAPDGFSIDAVAETLRRTTTGGLRPGDPVNLERALEVGDRLGGHIVQGHVDGTGTVEEATPDGDGIQLRVTAPEELLRYVVEKGSIAVDGVSLTVASRPPGAFTIALIPHTIAVTTLGPEAVGRAVNLEVDLLAKYVEALAAPYLPRGV
ncbi:MAG: riboflavin synthase [Actinomycetota bacterium]